MALQRRLATFLLALAGAVSIHWVVYSVLMPVLAGHVELRDGHGYLPVASSLVLPAGVLSVCWFSVRSARSAFVGYELTSGRLGVVIAAMFSGQELLEQVVAGGVSLADPALLLGAVLAIPAAILLAQLVLTVEEIVRELDRPAARRFGRQALRVVHSDPVFVPVAVHRRHALGRAPPELI